MPSHIFISYARPDIAAAAQIATVLQSNDIKVWYDQRIDVGAKWAQMIEAAIDSCFGMIVIMTASAETSEWVNREIDRAELFRRPVFPLLLAGRVFDRLADHQYEHCGTTGWRPSASLLKRLGSLQSQARSYRRLHFCNNCRKQFLPEEEPYCSYHPNEPTIVGNLGPRSSYEDVWQYPCCKRQVVTAVNSDGSDMTPPLTPGCIITDRHSSYRP